MKEIWKEIKDFNNYQISNLGRVKNNFGKILKPQLRHGYYDIGLYNEEYKLRPKLIKIHRLVAETFIPNPNNYPVVNHKDENKINNSVNNLEWCTTKYNLNYGKRNNKIRKRVLQFDSNNNFIKEYNSITEASKECNIPVSCICRSCVTHYKTGGYIWRYA